MAMRSRPERARSARRGDLTVRTWYRRLAPERGRARIGARTCTVAPCVSPTRSPPRSSRGSPQHRRWRRSGGVTPPSWGWNRRSCWSRAAPTRSARLDGLGPGFWIGWCSFELGHSLERVPRRAASAEPATVPDVVFARFGAVAVVAADGVVQVHGDGAGRARLEGATSALAGDDAVVAVPRPSGRWQSSLDRDAYRVRVDAVLELLRAGQCYQVNLTRRLSCDHALDPVALYGALARHHPAPHTAMVRIPDLGDGVAVVSASPERYLRLRGAHVETRPSRARPPRARRWRPAPRTTPRT